MACLIQRITTFLSPLNTFLIPAFILILTPAATRAQTISIFAGIAGSGGFSGDGGQATSALLNTPRAICVDANGNVYFSDQQNFRIRKITNTGIISTVAGTGISGSSGDNGPATSARLGSVEGLFIAPNGDLYLADNSSSIVRKIGTNGIITTVAGNRTYGFSGDGGPATSAALNRPYAVTMDASGNLYIADRSNHRIRKVDANGIITTIAGNGTAGFMGDGPATVVSLNAPTDITIGPNGELYIADQGNHRIRSINSFGNIGTVAGTGSPGFSGDGSFAVGANLHSPSGIRVDASGKLIIADYGNYRVREVDLSGIIRTIAGNGQNTQTSQGAATLVAVVLNGLALRNDGSIYLSVAYNQIAKLAAPVPPTLSSFSPTSAKSNGQVIITGTNLAGISTVTFGGYPAASFFLYSNSQINAFVGGGASGDVVITTRGGSASKPGFNYIGVPVINSFTPTTFKYNDTITINGSYLNGASSVSFGSVAARAYTVIDANTIKAKVGTPNPTTGGNVIVTTPGGTAQKCCYTFLPAPEIGSFTPTSATTGQEITINGNYFNNTTGVSFGGVPASSFTIVSDLQLKATVGAGNSGNVTVTGLGGSNTLPGFTYVLPTPSINSFTPASSNNGGHVMITGVNFLGASSVSFGGIPASSFTVIDNNSIDAVVGNGASGSISVTTPGGIATKAGFNYLPPPTITLFTPTSGKYHDTVTISGNNFIGCHSVSFGNMAADTFMVISNTTIKARLDSGSTGAVSVSSPGGTASLAGFTYTGPSISLFSPVAAASGTTVTISGTNLAGASGVYFGDNSALSFTVLNANTITAVVASGASGAIKIVMGSDTISKAGFSFLYSPLIYSFSPQSATPGSAITIKGAHFTGATAVSIANMPAADFLVLNDSLIKATVSQTTQGAIMVTTPGGTASLAGFYFEPASCAGGIAYISSNFTGDSYQWQVNDGNGFKVLNDGSIYSFTNSKTLKITNLSAAWSGYQYRCNVNGTYSSTFVLHITNRWNGTQDNSWENAGNWNCGVVPDSNSDVTISAAKVLISSNVRVKSLRIDSSAQLNVAAGKSLWINGQLYAPVKIEKVGLEDGKYFLHPKTPALLMKAGESITIPIKKIGNVVSDSIPSTLSFSSSNTAVATVNSKGLITAQQVGMAIIECTDAGGVKARILVEIRAASEVPALNLPYAAGFSKPLYYINILTGGSINVSVLNRLGNPVDAPATIAVISANYYQDYPANSNIVTPEGGFALMAKVNADFLIGEAVLLAVNAGQSQLISGSFSSATQQSASGSSTNGAVQNCTGCAFTTPPPGLPKIFHVALQSGSYPVIFTNKGLTSEPVQGNVFRLVSYKIMFGESWTGFYGITIMSQVEEVRVEVEAGSVASASGSRIISVNPGIEKWRVIPEDFVGVWNKCQVYADYSGEWCCTDDTYGHSIKIKVPKAPDKIFYEGPKSIDIGWLRGTYDKYYKIFMDWPPPGYAQIEDGIAQFTDNSTGVTTPRDKLQIGPEKDLVTGLGFFNSDRTRPLQQQDVFAGILFNYYKRSARLKWVNANEFGLEIYKPIYNDVNYGSWYAGAPFKRCPVVFAPEITSVSPLNGTAGTPVTITGFGFANATGVNFSNMPAASFVVVNDNTITAVLSAQGASGKITITTAGGSATSEGSFTFIYPAPLITSFDGVNGRPGWNIYIEGSHFTGATAVSFGGVPARWFQVCDDSNITAIVSSFGASGKVSVMTTGGEATKDGFTFIPDSSNRGFCILNPGNGGQVSLPGCGYWPGGSGVTWKISGDSLINVSCYSHDSYEFAISGPINEMAPLAGKTYNMNEISLFYIDAGRSTNDRFIGTQGTVTITKVGDRLTGTMNNVLLYANRGYPNEESTTLNGTFDLPMR